jgi:hypothetical protein
MKQVDSTHGAAGAVWLTCALTESIMARGDSARHSSPPMMPGVHLRQRAQGD